MIITAERDFNIYEEDKPIYNIIYYNNNEGNVITVMYL